MGPGLFPFALTLYPLPLSPFPLCLFVFDLNLRNSTYTLAHDFNIGLVILDWAGEIRKRRRHRATMERLIKTLPAILKASGAPDEVAEAACVAAWKHAVGEGLSSHAVPVQLQNSTLVVAVADNIWKKQLEQMRGQLLFRLNSVLGQALVKSIELQVDPHRIELTRAKPSGTSKYNELNYEVPAELLTAAAAIEDVDLRRAFLGAATSCVKRLENPEV